MKSLLLGSIRWYQKANIFQNPVLKMFFLTDAACKFQPTCSNYMYKAIEKYGSVKGVIFGMGRIIRCHPWSKGGYDPVT